uniref:Uncharacterized protein n=1 Tax=Romanomermis culicivorax TaxID=13658 RepID=A0A915HP75_ROMCU
MARFLLPQSGQFHHQFLVPLGMGMRLPMIILPLQMAQVEETMDVAKQSSGGSASQRPPFVGNLDYISPLKQEYIIQCMVDIEITDGNILCKLNKYPLCPLNLALTRET